MDNPTSCGPKQRAWIAAGYPFFFDDDLTWPIVLLTEDCPPIAVMPSFARGQCLEMCFGWCMADLREQRHGEVGMLRALQRLGPPLVTAVVAATLALGLNPGDGLNAIERIVYQAARLVG